MGRKKLGKWFRKGGGGGELNLTMNDLIFNFHFYMYLEATWSMSAR